VTQRSKTTCPHRWTRPGRAAASGLLSAVATSALLLAGCGASTKPAKVPPVPAVADTAGAATESTTAELAAPAFPDEPFRATQPEAGAPRPFQLPAIKRFTLRNGIEVYLVQRHELPTLQMELQFRGGSVTDSSNKVGLASICMAMLAEGTQALEKLPFEAAQRDIGSSIGSYANHESQGLWMSSLSKHADATVALWADTLLRPGFRDAELERLVRRSVENLKQEKGAAPSVASRVSGTVYYGKEHPFGRIVTEASLQAIKIGDCRSYHKQYIKPQGARLFVVGNITEQALRAKLEPVLGKWRGKPRPLATYAQPSPRPGRIFFIDVPKSAQSLIQMGHLGPKRNADDFFPTSVMSTVLGGGFSSRVNMNLREAKGYAYGAGGGFSYHRNGSRLSIHSNVVSDKTSEALREMHKEYEALRTGSAPITEGELHREQNGAILSLPALFSTSRAALGQYQSLVFYDLPMDYFESYVENVQSVTGEQVMAAAKTHLRVDDLKVIVAGDGQTVLPGLYRLTAEQTFGKGDLVVLDADGTTVEAISPAEAGKRAAAAQ
jgi:zinc protease